MDERTRTTDDETAPELRRTAPVPIIETKRGSRSGLVVGLIVLIAVVGGGYWLYRSFYAATTGQHRRAQSAGRAAIGWCRHRRPGRHPRHRQRARHGDADRDRHRADPDQRPAPRSGIHRRANGQEGRFPGANRPAALSASASAVRGPACSRSRPPCAGASRPDALPEIVRAEFDRAPAIRGSGLCRPAVPRRGEARPGAGGSTKAQRQLLLPHRFPSHRPHRPAPGRSGKLHSDQQHHGHRRGHSVAADHGDLPHSGGRSARYPAATECRHAARSVGLRSRQRQNAGHRPRGGARQPDRHHDRHRQGARAVRQCRQPPVSEPIRERTASGEDAQQRRHRADRGDPARRTGKLRLRHQRRQHRIGAADQHRSDRRPDGGGEFRLVGRRARRGRRHRPLARRRARDRARCAAAGVCGRRAIRRQPRNPRVPVTRKIGATAAANKA